MSDMSDKQTPIGFIEKYASISDMDTTQVISLLDIQDKQDTKYSRVKTCLELWNAATEAARAEYNDKIKAMQAEIDKGDDRVKELSLCVLLLNHSLLNAGLEMSDNFVYAKLIRELNQRGEDE